jgi:hypothetical protein
VTADPKATLTTTHFRPTQDSLLLTPRETRLEGKPFRFLANLGIGLNRFQITVTAEDGISRNVYTLEATRTPRNIALMDSIRVTGGSNGAWSPVFASTGTAFTWSTPFPFDSTLAKFTFNARDSLSRIRIYRVIPTTFSSVITPIGASPALGQTQPLAKVSAENPTDPVIQFDVIPLRETLEFIDSVTFKGQVSTHLDTGTNTLLFRVFAEDTTVTHDYRMTVKRGLSPIAKLKELVATVPLGTQNSTGLFPAFHRDSTLYSFGTSAASLSLFAVAEAPGSKLSIDGKLQTGSEGTLMVPLSTVARNISVLVIAPDGIISQEYIIKATRNLIEPILIGPPIQVDPIVK